MNTLNLAAFVVGLFGFAALVTGIALMSVPVAFMVGGGLAIIWSAMAANAAARQKAKG
jgi:hypothetical protein